MFTPETELQVAVEELMEKEIIRLLEQADSCVFVLYDPNNSVMEPLDYICHEKVGRSSIQMKISLNFEGIGVWYMLHRDQDHFTAKKILLQITDGQFKHGQMGDFEGKWDDFPLYIMEDRWVQAQLVKLVGNDQDGPGIAVLNDREKLTDESEALEASEEPKHWYEPPEVKDDKPEVSLFAQDDLESKDLDEIFADDQVVVDQFPARPFSRFAQ